ncbi:MAG: extracellular solute-binding protein [Limnochordia bacterium]|nr:extracellular solute-binding protein [Limnochordia bacterium]MDD2630643.1 extracellular solute-binding protein [Limnochordia bacterium]
MRQIRSVLVILLGIMFALSGASQAKVKLIYTNNVSDVTANVEQQLIDLFMAENPEIEVEYHNAPITPEQLLLWTAGGMCPDVFMVHSHTVSELVGQGLLAPLDEHVCKDGEVDVEDLFPEGVEEFSHEGVLYGIPYEYHMVAALFYNVNAVAESGLAPPPSEWPWEDFLKYAAKLTRMDGNEITRWPFYTYHPLNFMHSWGGALVDDWRNPTDTLIDSAEAIAGYEAYVSLNTLGLMAPSGYYTQLFLSGTVAMVVSGLWGSYSFADANFEWDITLPPLGEGPSGGRGYEFVSRALGMSAQTKHAEEAFKLLKFLAYDERALKTRALSIASQGVQGEMPARISVARGEAFVANDLGPKNKMLMLMVADDVYRMPRHPEARRIWNLGNQVGVRGIQGESIRNVAISVAEQVRAILRQDR